MRRSFAGLLVVGMVLWSGLAYGQGSSSSPSSPNERKVSSRVAPVYPELAKKMHLRGVVRVEAIVRPNGSVKTTRALGGNPVLVDAAVEAVGKWKFEPAQNETTEVVQLTFDAQ